MRRLSLFTAFTAAGLLAVAVPSFAQQPAKPAPPAAKTSTPAKPSGTWASGKIERVDATSIVIKQGTHEMTFALAPDAKLIQGKKTLQPGDLSGDVGKTVKVQYTMKAGTRTASRVEVSEPAKSGK